jgi:hypothetical protein
MNWPTKGELLASFSTTEFGYEFTVRGTTTNLGAKAPTTNARQNALQI